MGKRVHVDILFTATTITVLLQILFQTGGQIGIKAMPGIFSPPGFFLIFYSTVCTRGTTYKSCIWIRNYRNNLFRKKAMPLCCKEELSLFDFFVIRKLKFDLFLRRSCARDACVPCAKGLSRDTRVKASIEALEEHVRTARCPGRGSRAHLTAA